MSWRTNGLILSIRDLGRKTGVNRFLASRRRGSYEDHFQKAMLNLVRKDDTVWDVGANQGIYSRKFSEIVGPLGQVFAFEPSHLNLENLRAAVQNLQNVVVLPVALGREERLVAFQQGNDALGATSRIVDSPAKTLDTRGEVYLMTGDDLISQGKAALPNVIKIDTEGFELDVLQGLAETLQNYYLRALCIEVHFGQLRDRGLVKAAAEIESLLKSAHFAIAWPDTSHIVATRTS